MKRTISSLLSLFLSVSLSFADNLNLSTVVIDAGHGGKDAGCVSKDQKTYEKTLTLDIAKSLASMIREEYPEIKVVLTRDKDVSVSLNDRALKANQADADLFISIHINSTTSTSPNGYSVHILGQANDSSKDYFSYNMDVVKRENSVILLEEDYSTTYQGFDPNDPESYIFMLLMQNAHLEQSVRFAQIIQNKLKGGPIKADRGLWQNGFYVLWKTSMPSVLVELGFISNKDDLAVLRKQDNRNELAKRLFESFKEYKKIYDSSLGADAPEPKPQSKEVRKEETGGETDILYAVQIFASSRNIDSKDKRFLGYKPKMIKSGNLYKYFISVSENQSESEKNLSKIKSEYPDAFLVKIEGEKVNRLK